MVNFLVERATSDLLIGPDWAMNLEICDICNRDPGQAKDVVKGIKKRMGSKKPKVQLLALTLLEAIVKNCGDILHMYVAEKGLCHQMVKIVRKKPDFNVKEKILVLIDTWQEAFGGPRARYPQYYGAYQELLRIGAVFPQRSAPVLTPPQTLALTSDPHSIDPHLESREDAAESSADAEYPTLSLSEIQNARGIMDVLAEMLNALGPENKEGLTQDVVVDLVEQCRTYKQRLVHLVNSTTDESLLCQGLALNDDLQRVLAKHAAIATGVSIKGETSSEPAKSLVDVDAPLIDTGTSNQSDQGSTSSVSLGTQLLLTAAPSANGPSTTPTKVDPMIDLLSGDGFASPKAEDALALVPVGEPQQSTPASQQNALAILDMFSQPSNNPATYSVGQGNPSSPQFQQQNFHSAQPSLYPNGSVTGMTYGQGSDPAWNGQMSNQQQPAVYGAQSTNPFPLPPWEAEAEDNQIEGSPHSQRMQYNPMMPGSSQALDFHNNQALPGSPHALSMQNGQLAAANGQQLPGGAYLMNKQAMQSNQMEGSHPQPFQGGPQPAGGFPQQIPPGHMANQSTGGFPQQMPPGHIANQSTGGFPQQMNQSTGGFPQQMLPGHMANQSTWGFPQQMPPGNMAYMYSQQMYGSNQMAGYGYGNAQQQYNAQYLNQGMSGLSMTDNGFPNNLASAPAPSYVPSGKPSKPQDKLFGDLVDLTKFKPTNSAPGRAGST